MSRGEESQGTIFRSGPSVAAGREVLFFLGESDTRNLYWHGRRVGGDMTWIDRLRDFRGTPADLARAIGVLRTLGFFDRAADLAEEYAADLAEAAEAAAKVRR